MKGLHKRRAQPRGDGYVVVRLPDGTTATGRMTHDGSIEMVAENATEQQKRVSASGAEEKAPPTRLSESSYRELMAVLAMDDTGLSRRGSL